METRGMRQQALELVKQLAATDPVETIDGVEHCKYCGAARPEEGHNIDPLCIWLEAHMIVDLPRKEVDQPRQDVHDFLIQLKTYRNYPAPLSMTIDTLTANLGHEATRRIEQAVMKRLAEVEPGIHFFSRREGE